MTEPDWLPDEGATEPIRAEPTANPARVRVADPEETDQLSDEQVPAPGPDGEE